MAPGQLKTLLGSIRRKPATAPDGKTTREAAPNGAVEKTSVMHDIMHGGLKNAKFLAEALPALASGDPLDDKELLLEHGVAMLQGLPLNSGLSATVSDGFIKMLYNDLPHPSTTLSGPTARYRRHDGGNNNIWNPEMGKAGSPYARNVPPTKPKGPNLPDPELVYEQLLKRPEGSFKEHPSGLNRMFFSFATIVIHECFQTSRTNQWINETSSYVDLSTLYGNTEEEQPRVRTYNNGLIYPDSIASERIMLMPPGVVACLLLFSRNHNTIAKNLLSINEDGKYRDWDSLNDEQKKWQDNDIFQLARNINVGFFATVVLKDYVAAILNTPRANSEWSLDLGKEIKSMGQRVERGTGNVVSVEFAVLYHWHAALSAADARWMEELLRYSLPDLKSLDDMTPQMFFSVVMKQGHELMSKAPKDWTFNGLTRGEDGHFSNTDLAELIKDCIEEPAHAFGPHGTPASLKVVDVMGQLQARELFNVCTLNEFRAYLNLKPYESFLDWCEDKDTARAAELLYSHIDNMELYPGLMAECTKPPIPGSGVCPGQTTGRGILDDAVALVRGDRFLSYDFNSNTLTNWGISKVQDIPGGAYGGMLPKLIFGGLPFDFTGTSAYALLPFYTPKAVGGILTGNKVADQYDLKRPRSSAVPAVVYTFAGCKAVREDIDAFRASHRVSPDFVKLFFEDGFESKTSTAIAASAAARIQQSSLKYPGIRRSIDIVRDVCNTVPIQWVAQRFAIPIKSEETPRGLISISELFSMLQVLYAHDNFNVLPVNEWKLRQGANESAPVLRKIIGAHLRTQSGFKEKIVDRLEKGSAFEVLPDADRLFHSINSSKQQPVTQLVEGCVRLAAAMGAVISQQAALLIDLFLTPSYEQYKTRIVELAHQTTEASTTELEGFVLEGLRHAGAVLGVPRIASKEIAVDDGHRGQVHVQAQQIVIAATSVAAMDATAFPEPEKLDPNRPRELYNVLLAPELTRVVAPAVGAILREVFKLTNIRRAVGKGGHFTTTEAELAGVKVRHYLNANACETAWPTSLRLEYDEVVATNGAVHTNGAVLTNGAVHTNGTAKTNGTLYTNGTAQTNGTH